MVWLGDLMLTAALNSADNPAMNDRRNHRCGAASAIILLLPLLYVLSTGPSIASYFMLGEPESLGDFLLAAYSPLIDLPQPIDSWLDFYIGFWVAAD